MLPILKYHAGAESRVVIQSSTAMLLLNRLIDLSIEACRVTELDPMTGLNLCVSARIQHHAGAPER